MAKRISIINFKGGVGKTTLAFHLATGLARYHDSRVLLIDIDHQSSLSILCLTAGKWQQAVNSGRTVDAVFGHVTVPGTPLPGKEIIVKSPVRQNLYPTLDLVPASLHLDDTEIELAASQTGNPIASEWFKRTLLCRWLEATGIDEEYTYIIVDCPPATKIVSQNAIAMCHGYVVPVWPEAVMERGAPHLVKLIRDGIDAKLDALAKFGKPTSMYVPDTKLVGLVVTRIATAPRAYSRYTQNHTQHLYELQRRWGNHLLTPYIEQGTGIPESLSDSLPVFDRENTQNVGYRGFGDAYRKLVANVKARIDAL